MPVNNIIRFHITPQTHVRSTHGDTILFQMPEECPKHCGLPRRNKNAPMIEVPDPKRPGKTKMVRYGCPHMLSQEGLDRKRRLHKYNEYKQALNALALQHKFSVPSFGWSLYFFIPLPDSMYKPQKNYEKSKRFKKHGTIHDVKPDWDNFAKAFQDALVKQDGVIGQLSGIGKFWVDVEPHEGWIEVHLDQPIYDPFGKYDTPDRLKVTKDVNGELEMSNKDYRVRMREVQFAQTAVIGNPYDAPKSRAAEVDEWGAIGKQFTATITEKNHVSVNDKATLEEVFKRNKNRKRK